MRASYTQLYLHCVWATWDRLPLIKPEMERRLYAAMDAKCREFRCTVIALGGTSNHIHLLVRLPTTITIAKLIGDIKGTSSHLMTHELTPGQFFKWQGAYGAFTVSKDDVDAVTAYIRHQKTHHTAHTLIEEWETHAV